MGKHKPLHTPVLVILTVLLLASLACGNLSLPQLGRSGTTQPTRVDSPTQVASPTRADSPTLASPPDVLVIRSYPPGLKTYVVPKSMLTGGDLDNFYLTSKDYWVGYTPVETKLEPGEYRVTITNFDTPINFREDGEVSKTFSLELDGNKVTGMKPAGKTYAVTKRAGHTALLTALFWDKEQSLEEFVKTLPGDETFKISQQDFEKILQQHKVPSKDWTSLLSMLRRTGKAVWYDADPAHYLIVYFIEPDQVTVSFGNP